MKPTIETDQLARSTPTLPGVEVQFRVPRLSLDLAPRPALWAKLDAGRSGRLTLVIAPAGYGKSTTLASWVEQRRSSAGWADTSVAWYSVDSLDNQLHRLCSQLVAALRVTNPAACRTTLQVLNSTLPVTPDYLAMHFLEDVAALPGRTLLILDDYHNVQAPGVHAFWERVLNYAPPVLGIVIASRSDLPFSVARLRSQGHVAQLGLLDLQLSAEESQHLLSHLLDAQLTSAVTAALHRHVEGWGAGIRLLALSLRDHPDLAQVTASLSRRPNRVIAGYFMDEVLAHQPPALRDFLLYASLLPVLDAELCAAALDAVTAGQSRALFETAVAQNLFVIPLDARGDLYRFHELFRTMLQERLRGAPLAADCPAILLAAAGWYDRQGDTERALECALASGAPEQAAAILARHVPALQENEQWRLLERYLNLLPPETVECTPALLLSSGWLQQYFMRPRLIRSTIEQAAALLAEPQPGAAAGEWQQYRAELGVLSIMPMISDADLAECERRSFAALQELPASRNFVRGNACYFLARHYHRHGALNKALGFLAEAGAGARDHRFVIRLLHARCLILINEGLMQSAGQAAALCLEIAERAELPVSVSFANMIAAVAAYMQRDDEHALGCARAVLSRPHATIQSNSVITAFISIRMLASKGMDTAAAQVAAGFRSLALGIGAPSALALAQMLEAEWAILNGRAGDVRPWLAAFDPAKVHPDVAYSGWVWATGLLHLGGEADLAAACAGVAAIIERCRSLHVNLWVVEYGVLLALVCEAQGDVDAALAVLQHSLTLGWDRGCRRSFLDASPALDRLLARLVRRTAVRSLAQEVQQARLRLHGQAPPAASPAAPPSLAESPAASLSTREIEILTLLARPMSCEDVAQHLGLSLHTVRNHARNINSKLDAPSRREAIRRARSLGLLPSV